MADEATDVQSSQIDLASFEADEQVAAPAEPSTAKEADKAAEEKPEAKDEEVKTPDVPTKTDTEDKSEAEAETEVDETVEDKPKRDAESRKEQLNTEIRDLVAQRNALKEEVTKANAEVYQPATEQQLVDEGLSATDAKVEALRQQIEMRDYNERVAEAQLTIESEANRVIQDFPTFNPDSPDYDSELATEAAELLQQNLITDPNTGQIIGSNVSPYQLYKTLARATGISATKAQLKGQQATESMYANADTASSAAPPAKPKDPLMALFEDPNS